MSALGAERERSAIKESKGTRRRKGRRNQVVRKVSASDGLAADRASLIECAPRHFPAPVLPPHPPTHPFRTLSARLLEAVTSMRTTNSLVSPLGKNPEMGPRDWERDGGNKVGGEEIDWGKEWTRFKSKGRKRATFGAAPPTSRNPLSVASVQAHRMGSPWG